MLTADLGPAERYRRWLAVRRGDGPGRRRHPGGGVRAGRATSAWSSSGTTATTCTPSRARPTRTSARCWRCGRTAEGAGAARRRARPHGRGAAAGRVRLGPAGRRADRDDGPRRPRPAVRPPATTPSWPATPAARGARLPSAGLAHGPRGARARRRCWSRCRARGYLPALACADCRTPARCAACAGPLAPRRRRRVPACRWCGRPRPAWRARTAAARRLRAHGRRRRAHGRGAGPGLPAACRCAPRAGDGVLADGRRREPALVVATPGRRAGRRGRLRARRCCSTAGRCWRGRPAGRRGGAAPVARRGGAGPARPGRRPGGGRRRRRDPAVQALVRWDPAGFAERELAERGELRLPPAARMAALTGSARALAELPRGRPSCRPTAEVLGRRSPRPVADRSRAVRSSGCRRRRGRPRAGRGPARRRRGAQRPQGRRPVRIQIDPAGARDEPTPDDAAPRSSSTSAGS